MYVEEWLDDDEFALEVRGDRMGRLLELVESATRPPTIEVRSIGSVRGLTISLRFAWGTTATRQRFRCPRRNPFMGHARSRRTCSDAS